MPYSPDQLEFLRVHMGVAIPPEFLESKRGEGKTTPPTTDPDAAYRDRLNKLKPALDRALSANLGDTGKMRAVADFAREKAAAGNFESALKALDALEKLISEAGEPGDAEDGRNKVDFAKLRLKWDARKKEVAGQLEALRKAILKDYMDPETLDSTTKLERILARFGRGLGDSLDGLYTATDMDSQEFFRERSTTIVEEYLDYVEKDPLISHVEANPFVTLSVRGTLAESLRSIAAALSAGQG